MTNGTGVNVQDENDGKSYAGRAVVEVSDGFRIGAFMGLHDYDNVLGRTQYGTAFGVDLDWGGWSTVHVQTALVGGDNWKELDATGETARFMPGQAVVTYYIPVDSERWEAIEPLVRVSWGDPDTDTADDAAWLVTPGLSMFVFGREQDQSESRPLSAPGG